MDEDESKETGMTTDHLEYRWDTEQSGYHQVIYRLTGENRATPEEYAIPSNGSRRGQASPRIPLASSFQSTNRLEELGLTRRNAATSY